MARSPQTKLQTYSYSAFIYAILDKLFERETLRLQNELESLVSSQEMLSMCRLCGVLHQGNWLMRTPAPSGTVTVKPVHDELIPQAEAYLADKNKIDQDRRMIKQILHNLLEDCLTLQDIRDALPENLIPHTGHQQLIALSRTRPPAWSLADKPRKLAQYERMLPVIGFYSAARMLY